MSDPLKQRIEDLDGRLASLKEELDRLDLEARRWAEKRNSMRQQIKALRTEVAKLKEKRDEINESVRELKNLREQAKAERREKHSEILKIREKLRGLAEKKPTRSMHDVRSEIERLEWKIQTTSLPVHDEKMLIDEVRVLETQLSTHRQIRELEEALLELRAEEKALETRANLHHERLSELANQSQGFHEKMTETLSEIQVLRAEADDSHQKYCEIKRQAQALHQDLKELLRQLKSLKQKLRQAEEEKQLKRQQELRKESVKKALEKLKRGDKLSWEEFKLLTEQKKVKTLKTTRKN